MFGRSFHRLVENASPLEFSNAVIMPVLHVALALVAVLIGHPWAATFWIITLIGDAVRLDAHLVYEDGLKSVSDVATFVVLGGMLAQLLAIFCLIAGA